MTGTFATQFLSKPDGLAWQSIGYSRTVDHTNGNHAIRGFLQSKKKRGLVEEQAQMGQKHFSLPWLASIYMLT